MEKWENGKKKGELYAVLNKVNRVNEALKWVFFQLTFLLTFKNIY